MNKDQIQNRIKLLEQKREETKSVILAYEGAIQDCQYWLTQLEQPENNDG